MKIKTFLIALSVTIFFTLSANANTTNIYLEGLATSGITLSGFQFKFIDDNDYGWPVEKEIDDAVFPPTEKNDFSVLFGPGMVYPNFWDRQSLTREVTPKKTLARGFFGFSDYDDLGNTLVDGLFMTMGSSNTIFSIDPPSFLFWSYGTTDITVYEDVFDFQVKTEILNDIINVTVDFNPVPIPSTLLLLGGGILALISGNRRKNGGK